MINRIFNNIEQSENANSVTNVIKRQSEEPNSRRFADILQLKLNNSPLSFSAHASQRLGERNITLNSEDLSVLENAVGKAAEKGARDSLILYKDMSFIVNIPNKTVVTAMDAQSAKENVFTKIDSAIII